MIKTLIIASTLAAALFAYESANTFILETDTDEWECYIYPGTDTCVGCTDDCLEPLERLAR